MHLIYLSGCYISLFLRNRRWILEIHGIITVKPGYLKVSRREKARDGKDGRKETEIEGEEETKRRCTAYWMCNFLRKRCSAVIHHCYQEYWDIYRGSPSGWKQME